MIRPLIEREIAKHPDDPGRAAVAVCLLLEDQIGLEGNGWFDDDEVMDTALAERERKSRSQAR